MTEEVYAFFNAPKRISSELRKLREKRTALIMSTLPGAIEYDADKVQSSPSDRMCEVFCEIDELDRKIADLKMDLRTARSLLGETSRAELSEDVARVVCLRYIDGLQWQDVARAMHVSQSTAYRMHREAISYFDEKSKQ